MKQPDYFFFLFTASFRPLPALKTILLLDEPTNHLDAESIDWLEQHLQQYQGTVIAITHDSYFLDHIAGWIYEYTVSIEHSHQTEDTTKILFRARIPTR